MKRVVSLDLFDLTVKKSNCNEAIAKLLPHYIRSLLTAADMLQTRSKFAQLEAQKCNTLL